MMRLNKLVKYKTAALLLTGIFLSGCSTYSSSFTCGDARGANCMSMDRVDRMIAKMNQQSSRNGGFLQKINDYYKLNAMFSYYYYI